MGSTIYNNNDYIGGSEKSNHIRERTLLYSQSIKNPEQSNGLA